MSTHSDRAWPHHGLLSLFVWLWGANFVLAEVALREMAPISFSVTRFLTGGVALIGLFYWQKRQNATSLDGHPLLFGIQRTHWPRLLIVSLLGATAAPWLGIEGLNLTYGARASLWLAVGPILSSALGRFLQNERIGWTGYAGISLAAVGTVVLAGDGLRPSRAYWLGDLLLFLALLTTVLEIHLIKPLVAEYGSVPMVATRTLIGGLVYLAIASPTLAGEPWLTLSALTWIAILVGGGLGVGVGQWVKYRALNVIGPTRVVLYGNLVPVATLVLAWLTIGTDPTGLELLAAVLIVMGAICLQVLDPQVAAATESRPELSSS